MKIWRNNEWKFVFIIDICVLMKKRKISRWFLCSSSYFRHIFFSRSQQIFRKSQNQSVLTRAHFPLTQSNGRAHHWWKKRRFSQVFLPSEKPEIEIAHVFVCVYVRVENVFNSMEILAISTKNCLKMALERVGVAWISLVTNTNIKYLSSN